MRDVTGAAGGGAVSADYPAAEQRGGVMSALLAGIIGSCLLQGTFLCIHPASTDDDLRMIVVDP
ncbi:hypothetical protein [Erwinia amylovora]